MSKARQTVERTQLGLALLRLRNAAQKSQQEAAEAIGRTAARLSQVENGKGALRTEELTKLLDFYDTTDDERTTLLALGRASRRRQQSHGYVDLLPGSYQRLTDLLVAADAIRWYDCGIIPGPIQSPDYVRALMHTAGPERSEAEINERIALRLTQQRGVLENSQRKTIDIVFTEDTLRHVVGSSAVMHSQLLHMLQLIDQHPTLSIRIVPDTAINNPALGGGFVVLGTKIPIAFGLVLHGPSTYFDQAKDTDVIRRTFDRVSEIALTTSDSRTLLVEALREGLVDL